MYLRHLPTCSFDLDQNVMAADRAGQMQVVDVSPRQLACLGIHSPDELDRAVGECVAYLMAYNCCHAIPGYWLDDHAFLHVSHWGLFSQLDDFAEHDDSLEALLESNHDSLGVQLQCRSYLVGSNQTRLNIYAFYVEVMRIIKKYLVDVRDDCRTRPLDYLKRSWSEPNLVTRAGLVISVSACQAAVTKVCRPVWVRTS